MNRLKKFASIPQKALGTENPGLWKVFLWFHFDNLTIFAFSLALTGKVASESISLEIDLCYLWGMDCIFREAALKEPIH